MSDTRQTALKEGHHMRSLYAMLGFVGAFALGIMLTHCEAEAQALANGQAAANAAQNQLQAPR